MRTRTIEITEEDIELLINIRGTLDCYIADCDHGNSSKEFKELLNNEQKALMGLIERIVT